MKWKYRLQRTAAVVLCLLLCLCNMRTAASASTSEAYPYPTIIDQDSLCSLTLDFGVPGVMVRAYRVAEVSADVRFTLTGDFANYPVSLDNMTSAGWAALAQTLRGYAFLDNIQPTRTGVSDENGFVTFTDLPIGLYLVEGERIGNVEEGYRQPAPFVICLPNWEEITNPDTGETVSGWQYSVSARPKYTTLDGEVIMRRVLKVWDDAGSISRPAQISVTLLKDGEPYDSVELNAENNWRYAWDELDGDADWQMVETTNAGSYTVSVSLQGVTYVVTNSYSPPPPPENPPPENPPDDPPPENPPPENPPPENPPDNPPPVPPPPDVDIDEPDTPLSHMDPENPENPDNPDDVDIEEPDTPLASLPQTGQLWWPVPLLAMGGMMALLVGLICRRRSRDDEA